MHGFRVGDSIGLPYEGLSRRRVRAMIGESALRHRLLPGIGMVSDDTEHMVMTCRAYLASRGDPDRFARLLAHQLRCWLLAAPPASGLATARACVKLLVGFGPSSSGIRSAGNGPAMRAGILGVLCEPPESVCEFVDRSTLTTHTHEHAIHGARAVALASHAELISESSDRIVNYRALVEAHLPSGEMLLTISNVIESVQRGDTLEQFADSIGCESGVTGYVMHTVPIVLHAWLGQRNSYSYEEAVTDVVRLGGDTDSTSAILGGLLGLRVGERGIPDTWRKRICDPSVTSKTLSRLSEANENRGRRFRARPCLNLLRLPRNLVFFVIVLGHAVRRAFPPYR